MKKINVGLLGCGTVGAGVAKVLIHNQDIVQSRLGANLHLKYVADIDTETDRGITFEDGVFINDAFRVVNDSEIDIVVEMIGGKTLAGDLILAAIENGKHVVSANKALLSARGNEIFEAAHAKGVDLAYEASVGGCMPIIKTIRESLVGNRIDSMSGILNGTCNYILSRITDEGGEFADVLSDAQAMGYAEAEPSLDVDGFDTAHKLAILNALAYGMQIDLDNIYIEGIREITPMDIDYARQFGYRIKLLAISKYLGDGVEARVHPTMIPLDNPLTNVNGTLNAVTVKGDCVKDIMLYGRGAGMMPTASAVVGDIVDIARNILAGAGPRLPLLGTCRESTRHIPILPMKEITTHYYIRISALDRPGVLSNVSGILGNSGISIQSVQQKGRKSTGTVPIVMFTHRAKEANVKKALAEIADLDVIEGKPVLIRIEDENGEN